MSVRIRRVSHAAVSNPPRGPHAIRSTTIVAVRDARGVAFAGDGQVTFGQSVMKGGARKVRTLLGGKILTGFAGSAAALGAARALAAHSDLDAPTIARRAIEIASSIDIYTNGEICVESILCEATS